MAVDIRHVRKRALPVVNIWISLSSRARLLTSSYLWISEPSARERGHTISRKSIFKLSPVNKLLFQNILIIFTVLPSVNLLNSG